MTQSKDDKPIADDDYVSSKNIKNHNEKSFEKLYSLISEYDCHHDEDKENEGEKSYNSFPFTNVFNPSLDLNDEGQEDKITIDYMAKDYSSFRQALLDIIPVKIPQWLDRSEAYIGMMLLELFSQIHEELSYCQDRIAWEAYLPTATKLSSVKGHLALIDYYLREASSSNAFVKIKAIRSSIIPAGFQLSTKAQEAKNQVIFETILDQYIDPKHNAINLLDFGIDELTGEPYAILEKRLTRIKKDQYILFENATNNTEIVMINKTPSYVGSNTRITWSIEEKLKFQYDLKYAKICANIVKANHGKTVQREILKEKYQMPSQFSFKLKKGPLTFISEDSSLRSQSTLEILVDGELWEQTETLLECGPFDQNYSTSVGNDGLTEISFGDGVFGMMPSDHSLIESHYRFGTGNIGNVGKNIPAKFDFPSNSQSVTSSIENMIITDANGGKDAESIEEAKIAGPNSLKLQQRAVVLKDYEDLVKSRFQHYVNTVKAILVGSSTLKSISVFLNMKNGVRLDSELSNQIKKYVNDIKMIGYHIRVESAHYVPIFIVLNVFIRKDFDSSAVRDRVRMMFNSKINPDGSKGFFHQDNFDFGEFVYVCKIHETLTRMQEVRYGVISHFRKSTLIFNEYNRINTQISYSSTKHDIETERNLKKGYISINKHEIIKLDNDVPNPNNGILILHFTVDESDNNIEGFGLENGGISL